MRSAQVTARVHLSHYRDTRRCRLGRSNSETPTTGTSGSAPHLKTVPNLSGRGVFHFRWLSTNTSPGTVSRGGGAINSTQHRESDEVQARNTPPSQDFIYRTSIWQVKPCVCLLSMIISHASNVVADYPGSPNRSFCLMQILCKIVGQKAIGVLGSHELQEEASNNVFALLF